MLTWTSSTPALARVCPLKKRQGCLNDWNQAGEPQVQRFLIWANWTWLEVEGHEIWIPWCNHCGRGGAQKQLLAYSFTPLLSSACSSAAELGERPRSLSGFFWSWVMWVDEIRTSMMLLSPSLGTLKEHWHHGWNISFLIQLQVSHFIQLIAIPPAGQRTARLQDSCRQAQRIQWHSKVLWHVRAPPKTVGCGLDLSFTE